MKRTVLQYAVIYNKHGIVDLRACRLGVYFLLLTLFVCPSLCLFVTNIASSFFVSRWNRAIFAH